MSEASQLPTIVGDAVDASTKASPTIIPLRRTPPTRRLRHALLLLGLGVFPAVALPVAWFWWARLVRDEVLILALIAGGVAATAWLAWLFALPAPQPLVVDDDGVELPFGRRRLRLALPEILVARLLPGELVLFAAAPPGQTPAGHVGGVSIPRACFADDDGALHTVSAIRQRLRQRHGEGYVERLDENERRQLAFQSRRPIVVQGVAALCGLAFGLQVATDAGANGAALVRAGANASDLVMDGALWRVVTANLLHGSLLHLGMNLAALLSTGALVERWLGRPGMAVTLFASGVGGQFASAVTAVLMGAPRVSVGISGAVFGILGVLLVSTLRFRAVPTGGLRVPAATWVLLLLTNGALSLIPMVDVAAHVGGFVVGAAVAIVFAPRPGLPPLVSGPTVHRIGIGAGALVVAALVALGASLAR